MPSGSLHDADESRPHANKDATAAKPLAVCQIASGDRWAGAEVQIASSLRSLAKDARLQLSAVLLNPGRLADEVASCGIPLCVIPESENGLRTIVLGACRFLADRKVQIVHSHRYKENLIGAWAAWRLKIPHVVRTYHGLPEPQTWYRGFKQGAIHAMDRLTARHFTDRIISVSDELSRQLAQSLHSNNIVTIPNGIDMAVVRSSFAREEAKARLGIPPNCPVVGTAGRLEPIKRLDIFLRAAGVIALELAATSPPVPALSQHQVRFVIAGDGREAASLHALAGDVGLADRVLFLGHRGDIHDVLRAFDVLVLSSDHEGLPMVVLEALALAVPVVARAVGGIPEVIQNGATGLLVYDANPRELAGACLRVLADSVLAARLVQAGREAVQARFSADRKAERLAQLYFSLLSRA